MKGDYPEGWDILVKGSQFLVSHPYVRAFVRRFDIHFLACLCIPRTQAVIKRKNINSVRMKSVNVVPTYVCTYICESLNDVCIYICIHMYLTTYLQYKYILRYSHLWSLDQSSFFWCSRSCIASFRASSINSLHKSSRS